jgi:hypothetical protein
MIFDKENVIVLFLMVGVVMLRSLEDLLKIVSRMEIK